MVQSRKMSDLWYVPDKKEFHITMCRNIRTLYNFDPPATDEEIRNAALQYVRKISGTRAPSAANTRAFIRAVNEIASDTAVLLRSLTTTAIPKNRETESMKLRQKAAKRFGSKIT